MLPIYTPPPDDGYCGIPDGGVPGVVGAPATATYVVLTADVALSNERIITAGTGVSIVDSGPGAALTISSLGGGSFEDFAAGGSLSGTYPNPSIAYRAVGTFALAEGSVTTSKLDPTGVIDGTYGTSTAVGSFTVDNKGRLTFAQEVDIDISDMPVGGDLLGTVSAADVVKIYGRQISSSAPLTGQAMVWNGLEWGYADHPPADAKYLLLSPSPSLPDGYVISGDGNISINAAAGVVQLGLSDTGVVSGTYGDSLNIPVINVDDKGRISSISVSASSGGGAPAGAEYLLLSPESGGVLSNERVLAAGSGLTLDPGSPGGTATIGLESSGVVPGSYGADGYYTSLSIDGYGRVTSASSHEMNLADLSIASGDVTGQLSNTTVEKIQNRAVSSSAPTDGDVITWSAGTSQWIPASAALNDLVPSPAGTYGSSSAFVELNIDSKGRVTSATEHALSLSGDVSGDPGATSVVALRGIGISPSAPATGEVLTYDGYQWTPTATGGLEFAPIDSTYLVLSLDGYLTNERVLSMSPNLVATEGPTSLTIDLSITLSNEPLPGQFPYSYVDIPYTYGGAYYADIYDGYRSRIPVVTVDGYGRITGISTEAISIDQESIAGDVTGLLGDVSVIKIRGRSISATSPTTGQVLGWNGTAWAPSSPNGDVFGPLSSTDLAVPLFDGLSGKLLKNSALTFSALNDLSGSRDIGMTRDLSVGRNATVSGTIHVIANVIADGYMTATSYNGVVIQSHAGRHSPGGDDELATGSAIGIGAGNAEGVALSYARSDHNHAITSGGTDLTVGTIGIGQVVKRVGTELVGVDISVDASKLLTGNFSGQLLYPLNATARWYPPATVSILRVWASIGEAASGDTELDVKKNGTTVLASALIESGDFRSADVTLSSTSLAVTDYLTISLTTASGGRDAVVFVEYV
jgi:hypothetical protein